jgi:lysylphosphatidylglycerol synthetase-like protein (DUF2156 family)
MCVKASFWLLGFCVALCFQRRFYVHNDTKQEREAHPYVGIINLPWQAFVIASGWASPATKHVQALVQHTVRKAQAGKVFARELANMAYGAARCGKSTMLSLLFPVLARAAERRLSDVNPQNFANMAWACATVNYWDDKLLAALAIAAKRRLIEVDPQEVANTACAFATVNYRDEKAIGSPGFSGEAEA